MSLRVAVIRSLYAYVGNDPLDSVDPTGENAELYWTAPDQAKLTIRYTVVQQGAKPPFTRQQVQSAVAKNLSGTVQVNGKTVTVTAQAVPTSPANANGKPLNTITVVPDTNGVTQSGRAETNRVGGNSVTIGAAQDTATTVSHELGHTAGAGDQYKGGVDVGGNRLPADVPGPNSIMKDLSGAPANSQTLGEMLRAPTNTNTCAKGVNAATGGC
jgi:hypothetical protein